MKYQEIGETFYIILEGEANILVPTKKKVMVLKEKEEDD
jgi:hypothetical protein